MDKEVILLAWEHIKTLRGSNLGDYYCQFIHSGIEFDKDAVVIENMIDEYFNLKDNIKTLEEKYKKSLELLEIANRKPYHICMDATDWDEMFSYDVSREKKG